MALGLSANIIRCYVQWSGWHCVLILLAILALAASPVQKTAYAKVSTIITSFCFLQFTVNTLLFSVFAIKKNEKAHISQRVFSVCPKGHYQSKTNSQWLSNNLNVVELPNDLWKKISKQQRLHWSTTMFSKCTGPYSRKTFSHGTLLPGHKVLNS